MDGMVGKAHNTAPDLIDPVLGYKVLEINTQGIISSPYQRSIVWQMPKLKAKCIRHPLTMMAMPKPHPDPHEAPYHDCQCGIYSYYELEDVARAPIYQGCGVGCLTANTGMIEAHHKGMRSQHMEIIAVTIMFPTKGPIYEACLPRLIRRAKGWKIPYVANPEDLPVLAAELGICVIPESLRPEK